MSCSNFTSGRSLWTFSLGITFVCCSLITYNLLYHYKIISTPQAVSLISHLPKSAKLRNENCITLCTTNECIEIANSILQNMNISANPCDDFSDYACGNFREKFGKESNHSIFQSFKDDIYIVLKDIIETSNETQIAGSGAQKLKIVYDSCIDSKSSDLSTVQSMLQFLNHMGIENWPHLSSNFSFTYPTFEDVVGKLASYQEDIFFGFHIRSTLIPSPQGQDLFNISVAPHNPTYEDDFEIKELKKVVTGILHYTGMANKDINRTWEEFMEVENGLRILFEKNSEENADCEDEEGEMAGKDSLIDCNHINASENMVCQIWNSAIRNGRISSFHGKDRIIINCKYMYKLPKFLKSFHDRALAHYIALRVVINNLKYMSFSIRKNLRFFIKKPMGPMVQDHTVELDRWKFCVSWITENMKWPLGFMYVNRMWKKEAVDELDDIVNEYKRAIVKLLKEQEWIDENTKSKAIEQTEEESNAVSNVIELLRNRTKIDTDYRRFRPSRKNFFRNVMHHKQFQFIGISVMTIEDLIIQYYSLFSVNAVGGGGESIEIAFGILLPPVFKYGYPKLFNYAKIGQIIGHEIGHTLRSTLGYFREGLGNETRQRFVEKMNCLVDQYFSYELKRIKQNVEGNNTFWENFADNIAVTVTEKAAEKLIRDMEKNNFSLPGLSFSPEELLYISYAQTWCETRSIEKEYDYFQRDNHSPPEYRIIGNLQNSARFSEVFHCPSTSYMNPDKKCLVFD